MKRRVVVTDASCLIGLDRVGRLDLLRSLFEVFAPPAVVVEYGWYPGWWLRIQEPTERGMKDEALRGLDRGETEAIALAIDLGRVGVVLDERKGRRVAPRKTGQASDSVFL
jgi:predicted nucleic acid-binding protein